MTFAGTWEGGGVGGVSCTRSGAGAGVADLDDILPEYVSSAPEADLVREGAMEGKGGDVGCLRGIDCEGVADRSKVPLADETDGSSSVVATVA